VPGRIFAVGIVDIVEDLVGEVELVEVLVPTQDMEGVEVAEVEFAATRLVELGRIIHLVAADHIGFIRNDIPIGKIAIYGRYGIIGKLKKKEFWETKFEKEFYQDS